MTGWRMRFVLSGCLMATFGAAGARCYAQSASPKPSDSPSADQNATNDRTAEQGQDLTGDSSSRIADAPVSSADYDNTLGMNFLKNFAADQRAIWTSPGRLRLVDADWLLPLGTAAGLYLWGRMTHDDHKRETGFLAAEAALNSLALNYTAKYTFGRERPLQNNYSGGFWQGGDSFPSDHAAVAWSVASVVAHEYPGPLTSLLAYGMATAVSAARVDAKQHFPTDVLIGSALGWFVGQEVYRHHHDPENGGGDWETYAEAHDEGPGRVSTSIGSPYVELDSWIYPAIERLAALGYIHSEYLDMRPWTRIECAHLVEEAADEIRAKAGAPEFVEELYSTLEREFQRDLEALEGGSSTRFVRLESLYSDV